MIHIIYTAKKIIISFTDVSESNSLIIIIENLKMHNYMTLKNIAWLKW